MFSALKAKISQDAAVVGGAALQELFSFCGNCEEICEDQVQKALQSIFSSMPGKESDYFCHEGRTHYHFCQTDGTRYTTPRWNTSVWHYWYTFLAHSAGHTWWSPCAFNSLEDPDFEGNGCLSRQELGAMFQRVVTRFWGWTYAWYHKQIDADSDGCASTAEITAYLARRSPWCAFNLLHELPCLNSTDAGCKCSSGVSPAELSEHLLSSALKRIDSAVANHQEQVRNERANATVGQIDQGRGEEKSESTLLIALISGIIAIVTLVAFAVTCWYQHRQRNALRQPQKLLQAKLDAWSVFDDNLIAKTSTLHPLFVHCLGLGGFKSDQLSLLKITHDEDVEAMNSLLHQMKRNTNLNSLPLMAQIRLKYGITEVVDGDRVIAKSYMIQPEDYVNVEILMAWSSSASIIVGLTSLSEACPPRASCDSMLDFSAVLLQAQRQRKEDDLQSFCTANDMEPCSKEYILNPPSQVTGSASDAGSFRSMEAEDHIGGQITKEFNDFKSDMFKQAVSQRFSGEEKPEPQVYGKWSASAADSIADGTSL
eukprot:TRINITY_DN89231_c0_g1_i1.p1 TRINITY_DN89231_c0_g1~~TRINITY_DN89231_c0_g1_i1.p1  ORF type:complete len:540 (+),score=70.97 TRINITY_DN89231_c0_g1_i1:76-1695(+)